MSSFYDGLFNLPDRTSGSMVGSTFASSIFVVPMGQSRDLTIKQQILMGNVPSWMHQGVPIDVSSGRHSARYWALPDYACVGNDDDYVRCPMSPVTATEIAEAIDAVLPTRKMVNDIFHSASVKLTALTMPPTEKMTSTEWFLEHNKKVQDQLNGRSPADGLVAGHKKDVVICKALGDGKHNDRVAIYGWCKVIQYDGTWEVIQGLNPTSHDHWYADYSHGIRFVHNTILVDPGSDSEKYMSYEEVLSSPELSPLLSDEGPLTVVEYPGT